jgi:hypothetical protein
MLAIPSGKKLYLDQIMFLLAKVVLLGFGVVVRIGRVLLAGSASPITTRLLMETAKNVMVQMGGLS